VFKARPHLEAPFRSNKVDKLRSDGIEALALPHLLPHLLQHQLIFRIQYLMNQLFTNLSSKLSHQFLLRCHIHSPRLTFEKQQVRKTREDRDRMVCPGNNRVTIGNKGCY
jgi:hypothetical protein